MYFEGVKKMIQCVAQDSHIFQEVKYHDLKRKKNKDDILYSLTRKMFVVTCSSCPESKLLCDCYANVSPTALKDFLLRNKDHKIFEITHMLSECDWED